MNLGISPNHNQTVVRQPWGTSFQHNQTIVRKPWGSTLQHNQTIVRQPGAHIQHSQALSQR